MTSYRLKLIAISTMMIDHLAKILINQGFLYQLNPNVELQSTLWILPLTDLMEWIGRIAFPLFAFMIAEGCGKTRSIPKYVGRLALFAVISQPFFYITFNTISEGAGNGVFNINNILNGLKSVYTLHIDNVFAVLAVGALSVWIFRSLSANRRKWLKWLIIPILGVLCLALDYRHVGYGSFGVILIFLLSLSEGKAYRIAVMAIWLTVFYLGYNVSWQYNWLFGEHIVLGYLWTFVFSLAAPLLVYFYNGKRGVQRKWIFYAFYPAHIMIICAIKTFALL